MPTPMSLIFLPPEAAPMVTKPTCFCFPIALPLLERGVERDAGGSEGVAANHGQRVWRAPVSVHARVLPFDRKLAVVPDSVQGSDQRFVVHHTLANYPDGHTPLLLPHTAART